MSFTTIVSVSYKNIWEDYENVKIVDLLRDIPTINALQIVSHFNIQLHTIERDTSKQIEFLKVWIDRLPQIVRNSVTDFVDRIQGSKNAEINFINNISSLKLVEYILENYNEILPVANLTPEQELSLFKAYLYCSQEWTDKQVSPNPPKISSNEDLINMLLPIQLPYQDVLEFKDFRIQFLKAIYFFKFCETNAVFSDYLNQFLAFYKIERWQDYVVNILSLYIRKFERLRTPSQIYVSSDHLSIISFLDSLSVDISKFCLSDDFLSLREKPIFKIDNNNYIFLNLNFLVDKIFSGIQFEFAQILIGNNAQYNGKPIINFPNFKSIYAEEFSECGLFYNAIEYAFEKSKYIMLKGSQIKDAIGDGEPDYYIRDKSKVYIFEYKDILINAKTKHSYDISIIDSELSKKLINNGKGSAKGVSQLVNVIEKIRANEFKLIDNYNFEDVIIYPIIVYTDFSFNISGFNYKLNKEFWKQIEQKGVKNTLQIKDLVLIDLDSFIKFQDLFRSGKLKINNCLNEYLKLLKMSKDPFDRICTFNMYIHDKTSNMPYDTPKLLMEELKEMVP